MFKSQVTWVGKIPTNCLLCTTPITDTFVDGRTIYGPWACMCEDCHEDKGYGFGVGKGQLFKKQPDGTWLKMSIPCKV